MKEAMQCDLCESWEHVIYLRGLDKLDDVLYDALSISHNKALLYVCMKCLAKGSCTLSICLSSN